jgi:galactokinase
MRNFSGLRNCVVAREEPAISVEAPGRLEVLGNHTDYNEGVVLGAAIDRAVRIRGGPRADGRISLTSTSYPTLEIRLAELRPQQDSASWANYSLGVASEVIAAGLPIGGFSAEIESDLPARAGLGSSAAVATATAFFLLKLAKCELPPLQIAKLCQRAENRFAGVRSGLLDQVMSIFGRANHLVFFDCRTEQIRTIAFPPDFLFIVADSGSKRELAAGKYNERRDETRSAAKTLGVRALRDIATVAALYSSRRSSAKADERRTYQAENLPRSQTAATEPAALFRRAAHIVGENERVWRACELLERGDAAGLGKLMNESHESSRTNFENSTPELDQLVDLARKQPGVLGARLTGGGFGGAIIALCEATKAEHASLNLATAAAQTFICRPADGALARK